MWFNESNSYFCTIENFADGEINERSFSNPQPRSPNTDQTKQYVKLSRIGVIYTEDRACSVFRPQIHLHLIISRHIIDYEKTLLTCFILQIISNTISVSRYCFPNGRRYLEKSRSKQYAWKRRSYLSIFISYSNGIVLHLVGLQGFNTISIIWITTYNIKAFSNGRIMWHTLSYVCTIVLCINYKLFEFKS